MEKKTTRRGVEVDAVAGCPAVRWFGYSAGWQVYKEVRMVAW